MATETPNTPAPTSTTPDYAAISKDLGEALKAEGVIAEPPKAEAPPAETKTEPKPPEPKTEEAHPAFKSSFEKLAREQQQFRAERDAAKHGVELAKMLSPVSAAALAQAMRSGDAMGILSALGVSYTQLANQVAGAPPQKKGEEKPPETTQRVEDPEIAEIKAAWKAQQAQAQQAQILSGIKETLSGSEKFKHINALEEHKGVMDVLDEIYQRTGALPADNARDNILIAAEELESRLAKQAERFRKLTGAPSSASTQVQATETPRTPAEVGKTLTNKLSAPAVSAPTRFDPDAAIAELARDPNLFR